jgi:hypothetical protein
MFPKFLLKAKILHNSKVKLVYLSKMMYKSKHGNRITMAQGPRTNKVFTMVGEGSTPPPPQASIGSPSLLHREKKDKARGK